MQLVENLVGKEGATKLKSWFTISWFLFAVVGVPAYVMGNFELGHAVSAVLVLADCLAVAYVLNSKPTS